MQERDGLRTTFDLDPASGLPQLPAVLHDVRVLLETLGYLGVVILDLSDLDHVEAEFGRRTYNELLRAIAEDVVEVAGEVTGSDDFLSVLAPYGEEFVLFLEGPRGSPKASALSPQALEDVVEHLWLTLQPKLSNKTAEFGGGGRA
ncbi:MAG: hypothetical protein AAF658_18290, partial [Myxococcota bacterium]